MTKPHRNELRTRTLASLLDAAIPERKPLLESWLNERHLNMTFAAADVGKSMLTMSVALAVSGGGEYLGWKAPKPRSVLVVDAEMDTADLKERAAILKASIPGLDEQAAGQNLRFMARQDQDPGVVFPDLATPKGQDEVLAEAKACNATLVVLDNFSTLANVEDENAASSFNPVIDLMQNLKLANRAVILVHHARKGNGGGQSYRGTSKMEVVSTRCWNYDTLMGFRQGTALRSIFTGQSSGGFVTTAFGRYGSGFGRLMGAMLAELGNTM